MYFPSYTRGYQNILEESAGAPAHSKTLAQKLHYLPFCHEQTNPRLPITRNASLP